MFVGQQARLGVPFGSAQARLMNLIRGGRLLRASEDAYGEGIAGLLRVGAAPGVSRLVHARFRELVTRGDAAVLTLRWEAVGPTGRLFPALDADISLTADGDQATMLRIDAAYRPPFGALGVMLDQALLHRVADATIKSFVGQLADAIVSPAPNPQQARESGYWEFVYSPPEV